jgi:hypothetical protein
MAQGFYTILPAFRACLPLPPYKKSPLARNRLKRGAC